MQIIMFQHFSFDDPTVFLDWAEQNSHDVRVIDPARGIEISWLESMDLPVILGGPMSVYEEDILPWLATEKVFVQQAIHLGKKVLGICLGAQMIAEVLGGQVLRHPVKEIGWHRIERIGEAHPWLIDLPQAFTSFAWHGDTFTLPVGARRLASSEACANQAFAYESHVLALQFHLESTPASIFRMVQEWSQELTDEPYIQSKSTILKGMQHHIAAHLLLVSILNCISLEVTRPAEAV